MKNFPYIEPTIRIIAGFLITVSGCLIYARPDMELTALALLFFVSLNLLQSGFTHFCIMEKILKRLGFRSELGEIKNLNKVNADHLDTLNLLSEVVVELSSEGRIVRLTDSWGTLFGIDKADISKSVGKNFTGFMNIEDRLVMEQLLKRVKESSVEVVRFRMQRDDNSEHWTEGKFTLYSNDRFEPAIRGVLRDVTDSYLQEKRISHMAMHDALTNLPNRVLLEDRMERAVSQARRSKEKVAVLFVDLDNFKQVNDAHGHKIGDQLLVAISAILKKTLRGSDTLARWGGDEFVILLQGFNQVDDAQKIAEKLMGVLQQETFVADIDRLVTMSIGIAVFPDDADSCESLLIQADKALYFAKDQGRNNVQMYSQMRDSDLGFQKVDVTSRFAAAVKREEIQVYYQPVVDATSGRAVAFEALARWKDGEHGWVSPAIFIPMAENLGLMNPLGDQVLQRALQDLKEFLQYDPVLCMSLNVSNRQLFSPDFLKKLVNLLEKNGIGIEQVKLEITESLAMLGGMSNAKECLMELANAGFYLSIDDFGTGYSSLSYLHEFPVDELKIDISFVRRIETENGRVMVEAIAGMGLAMKLKLVAEGVENLETAHILQGMGVERFQGYYFGRPMPKEDCLNMINKQLPISER